MTRLSQLTLAVFFAAFLAVIGMAPRAQAATFPTGSAAQVELAGKSQAEQARYYGRRYGYRRAYYGRRHYGYRRAYVRPVYYGRRCWTRPRLVWTPYGYVRRWVRVCR